MFARIATFEGGDVEEMRRLNNERMVDGTADFPAGMLRASVLQGDRRLFISFFESREAMENAEQRFNTMGDEIPESIRGRRVAVESYEVIFDVETTH